MIYFKIVVMSSSADGTSLSLVLKNENENDADVQLLPRPSALCVDLVVWMLVAFSCLFNCRHRSFPPPPISYSGVDQVS